MIRVTGLTKQYGHTAALNDLTLTLPDGAIFGLLGPNGSGKSTFLKLLMRFIYPSAGQISLAGLAPTRIGYLPERPFFPPRSSITEYLHTVGRLGGLTGTSLREAVAFRLEQVGLHELAQRRIGTCSRGMLQRMGLATALLNSPALLLLDEPMGGLDPAWQKAVRDLVRSLAEQGLTVVISTHDLGDVEQLCTHVALLARGRLVQTGALNDVLASRPEVTITVNNLSPTLSSELTTLGPGVSIQERKITLRGTEIARKSEVLARLLAAGVDIRRLEQTHTTLEEVYLEAIRS